MHCKFYRFIILPPFSILVEWDLITWWTEIREVSLQTFFFCGAALSLNILGRSGVISERAEGAFKFVFWQLTVSSFLLNTGMATEVINSKLSACVLKSWKTRKGERDNDNPAWPVKWSDPWMRPWDTSIKSRCFTGRWISSLLFYLVYTDHLELMYVSWRTNPFINGYHIINQNTVTIPTLKLRKWLQSFFEWIDINFPTLFSLSIWAQLSKTTLQIWFQS